MTNEVIVLLGELVQVLSVTPLSWLVALAVEATLCAKLLLSGKI